MAERSVKVSLEGKTRQVTVQGGALGVQSSKLLREMAALNAEAEVSSIAAQDAADRAEAAALGVDAAVNIGLAGRASVDLSNVTVHGINLQIASISVNIAPFILAACAILGGAGGDIVFPRNTSARLMTSIEIPANIRLRGWSTLGNHSMTSLSAFGAGLFIDSTATITLGDSSGFEGLNLYRTGLVFGQPSTLRYATWLGDAVHLKANTSGHVFRNMAILGFYQGIRSENVTANINIDNITNNRAVIDNLLMNNINEIHIHNCADITRITGVHMWPAAQYQAVAEPNNAHIKSTGTGVRLTGLNDHTEVCAFTYGKARGFHITDGENVSLLGSSSDYPPGSEDESRAVLIDGSAKGVLVNSFRASGMDYAIEVDSSATDGLAAIINGSSVWSTTRAAIRSLRGDVQIVGGGLREDGNVAQGIVTGPNSGKTTIVGTDIRGFSTAVSNFSVGTVTTLDGVKLSNNTFDVINPYVTPKFTSFTPVITSGVGAFGSPAPSATCQYTRDGDDIRANYNITVPNNGTADADLRVTTPVQPGGGQFSTGIGRDVTQGGLIVATASSGSNVLSIVKGTTSAYPAVSGSVLVFSISYRA